MATTDAEFSEQVASFRLRRSWPQLLTMFFGGFVALTGIASVASHILERDEHLALPMSTAVVLYITGGSAFSWGGARFKGPAWPRWLAITLLSGSLFVVAAFLSGFRPLIESGKLSSLLGSRTGSKPTLASLLIDRSDAEIVVGSPADGPTAVLSLARRSSSVMWTGPTDSSNQPPLLTANVRQSSSRASRVRTKSVQPPVTRIPGVGDGCVVTRQATNSGEVVSVQAARWDWVITLGARGDFAEDPLATLLRLGSRGLDRLTQPDR